MPRPTRQQIDDEILDCAATLFARHGFKETSVQRIADTVGYSKTGLLHRYPSKEALQAAVIGRCVAELRAIIAAVTDLPPGPRRDRAAISAVAELALHRPGFVALLLSSLLSTPDSDVAAALHPVGAALVETFALTPGCDDFARTARVVGALGALAVARIGLAEQVTAETLGHLIDVSYDALGHPGPAGP